MVYLAGSASIDNISSFKKLYRSEPEGIQLFPNRRIEVQGINWEIDKNVYKAFGIVFAFTSIDEELIVDEMSIQNHEAKNLPDMIVLYDKQIIISKACFEDSPKFELYPILFGNPQGYVAIKCDEYTLSAFICSILAYVSLEHLGAINIHSELNDIMDQILRNGQSMHYKRF